MNGFDSGEDMEFDRSPKSFRKRLLRPSYGIKNLFLRAQSMTTDGASKPLFSIILTAPAALKKDLTSLMKN